MRRAICSGMQVKQSQRHGQDSLISVGCQGHVFVYPRGKLTGADMHYLNCGRRLGANAEEILKVPARKSGERPVGVHMCSLGARHTLIIN